MIDLRPMRETCGGAVGVEGDVDALAVEPIDLLAAVHDAQLVVLRNQHLDPARLELLANRLGTPARYPFADPLPGFEFVVEIRKEPDDLANFGGAWHTDTSYLAQPPSLTLLHAVEIPEGGDTLFADMVAAFDALSPGLQRSLAGMTGHNTSTLVHDAAAQHADVAGNRPATAAGAREGRHEADHPIVRVHPVTGRAALYVSRIHTAHFTGMTRPESLPMIEFLQTHATRPEFVTRLHWQPGTLAIWDNRTVQHNPLNDYQGARRVMHRVILQGERPVGADRGGVTSH